MSIFHHIIYSCKDWHLDPVKDFSSNLVLNVMYLPNYDLQKLGELKYAHDTDSGFDLKSTVSNTIELFPFENVVIQTGVKFEIPSGFEIQIRSRSGLSSKGILAAFGTVDEGYRGEVKVILYNLNKDKCYYIRYGDNIAQCIIQKRIKAQLFKVEHFASETERNENGFGSSDIKLDG